MTATHEDLTSGATATHTGHEPETILVRNPAHGRVVGSVPVHTREQVEHKAARLRAAQRNWQEIGPGKRKEWLLRFQDWMLDNTERITDVAQSESGKTRGDASVEVPFAVSLAGYWANSAGQFLTDEHPTAHNPLGKVKKLTTTYRPYPLVGVIGPWNFPFAMPALDVIPALAAGAAVLLKPSEVTPLSAVEFVRGWREIGAPPVLDLVTGYGEVGAAVVDVSDFVQFTGSTRTGRVVAQACAAQLKPYSLELGGKDPAIVLADADIDRAAHGIAWGALFNAGQVCISIERVYVEAPVYDEFVTKLTDAVKALRQGEDGRDYAYDQGALATPAQLEIVTRHVNEAIAAGAKALTGGKPAGVGTFFEPTVLVDVDHSMSCIREETFGPTIPVMKVADQDEAIALANDTRYGLSATVWTRDKARGEAVARQLDAGAVNINDALTNLFSFALPMGGWKDSGIGARWGGANGIRKYTRAQAITVPRFPTQQRELIWFPYTPVKLKVALGIMRAAAARGRRRLGLS